VASLDSVNSNVKNAKTALLAMLFVQCEILWIATSLEAVQPISVLLISPTHLTKSTTMPYF